MLNMKEETFYGAMLMIHNGKRCIYQGVFKITLWMDGTQCGNFRIFPSLEFYVKSILENLEVLKLLIFAISGILKFVNLVDFSL